MWLRQKKPPAFLKVVCISNLNDSGLDCGLKPFSDIGGTRKIGLPCRNINLFQEFCWHTDIECRGSGGGLLCLCDFGLLCAAGLSRIFACSHSFFPFVIVLNKLIATNNTNTNIFQHFFVVALWFHKVVTFGQIERGIKCQQHTLD